ncbi:hypothetical protein EYV94_23225 [Puteibacter caeruleilacunae]|nr:hypothetical protein EYV94_23225 [Puteibacter caeruleilacunae]
MEFYNHTSNWVKGEMFEALFIGVFGLLVMMAAVLFWKIGSTPNAKALLIPLMVVGLVCASNGVSMYFSNQKRLVEYKQSYQQAPETFVKQEKERVEGFMYMYKATNIMVTVFMLLSIGAIWFFKNHHIQAIAIALMLFALSGMVIDYFSKERALEYHSRITTELNH